MNKELSFEMVIHNRTSSSIHKNRINNNNKLTTDNRQRQLDRKEMQALLAKLKQLVPGIPKNRRCSKLEIIQHVIDYIFDLQTALEQHPIASTFAATALATADFVAVSNNSSNSQSQWMPSPTSQIASCDRYLAIVQSDGHQTHSSPQRTSNRQPLASIVL